MHGLSSALLTAVENERLYRHDLNSTSLSFVKKREFRRSFASETIEAKFEGGFYYLTIAARMKSNSSIVIRV